MKVLVLATEDSPNLLTQLHDGLRQQVGTCDFYYLSDDQIKDLRTFFDAFIRLSQYDRIVFLLKPSDIHLNWLFCRELPNLTVVSLGFDNKYQKIQMLKLYRKVPWLRYLSPDDALVSNFQKKGMDAHWLVPVFDFSLLQDSPKKEPTIHLLEKNNSISKFIKKSLPEQVVVKKITKKDTRNYIINNVNKYDIVVFTYICSSNTILSLLKAMASGSLVIYPQFDEEKKSLYQWDEQNSLYFNNLEDCANLINNLYQKIIAGDSDLEKYILSNQERVQPFLPVKVGKRIGGIILPSPRDKKPPSLLEKIYFRLIS